MNDNHSPLSSDEKLMGALPHFFGILVAVVVWMLQKDKSRFVKFQALQALVFDVIVMVTMGLVFSCLFGVMFLGMFGSIFMTAKTASSPDAISPLFILPFMFPFATFACVFPFSFLLLILRIIAAVSILNGRNYHYPILGNWLENFLDSKA
jgi:uncharacterized Tic20 family protein